MKKILAALLALATVFALAACGNKDPKPTPGTDYDALEVLTGVWEKYSDDDRFPAAGGDFDPANSTTDAPGRYGVSDTAALNSTFGLPEASASLIDGAASLMHMMNANTFTCGAFHVTTADNVGKLADALKDNILSRQWICGFPDKLVVFSVDNVVVSAFGNQELIDGFKDNLTAAYGSAVLLCEEPIA